MKRRLNEILEEVGRRFARLTARAVVARPGLWPLFRRPVRVQFGRLAPFWDTIQDPEKLAPLMAALERVEPPPRRALDLGTGTGKGARAVAERFPEAEVVGVDLAPPMVEQARKLLPPDLGDRVSFEVADAAALPYADGAFDLVLLLNAFPFFPELGRVTAPGGTLVVVYVVGPDTPVWTAPAIFRDRLSHLGFAGFEELAVGPGTAFLARKGKPE